MSCILSAGFFFSLNIELKRLPTSLGTLNSEVSHSALSLPGVSQDQKAPILLCTITNLITIFCFHILCNLKNFFSAIFPFNNVAKSFFFLRLFCSIDCPLWIAISLYVSFLASTFLPLFPHLIFRFIDNFALLVGPNHRSIDLEICWILIF